MPALVGITAKAVDFERAKFANSGGIAQGNSPFVPNKDEGDFLFDTKKGSSYVQKGQHFIGFCIP